jgi:hypothetical protein
MDPKILDYFRKKGVLPEGYDQAEQGVADAQNMQGYAGIAQAAGQLSDNFANSQKKDIVFANRMQDLGKRPEVQKAEQQKTDFSLANNLASSNTSQAQQKLEAMKADMVTKLRGQQADEKLQYDQSQDAAKAAFEREKFDADRVNKGRELDLKAQEVAAKGRVEGDPMAMQLKEQNLIKAKRENEQALNPSSKPLTGEQQSRADNVRMAKEAVARMSSALTAGDNTFSIVGDNDYTANLRMFQEAFGRMQSGGAIGKQEESRFRSMMPTITDSSEMQAKKLQMLSEELNKRETLLKTNGAQTSTNQSLGDDQAALSWAQANPDDPRAQQIMKLQSGR